MRIAAVLCAALLLSPWPAGATDLEGTWYVLIHYQDADTPHPSLWRWDERVWDFRRQDDGLVWTEFELISFMNVSGRFAGLQSAYARRLAGAWEPDAAQRREIERGLIVNPRGGVTLFLAPSAAGWRSADRDEVARRAALGLRLARLGSVERRDGGWGVRVEEQVRSALEIERTAATEYVFDGNRMRGVYASGPRQGRFRLLPTVLRDRVRPVLGAAGGRIRLLPDTTAQWENFLPMLARPWRYLPHRDLRVETLPPGALLDVSYLRDGARRAYEETRAPVTFELPSRLIARRSDAVEIRAFAPGYEPTRRRVSVHGERRALRVELRPAANQLREIWFSTLLGERTLRLFTRKPLALQYQRQGDRLSLVLPSTAISEGATGFGEPVSEKDPSLSLLQLGPNLLVRMMVEEDTEFRVRTGTGLLPDEHRTIVRLGVPEAGWEDRAAAAAADIGHDEVTGCALAFDAALRVELAEHATRALRLQDSRVRALLALALDRVAAASPGDPVSLVDGSRLATGVRLERVAALRRAADVQGMFAALRALARRIDGGGDETLRGLVSPGMPPGPFRQHLADADAAQQHCERRAAR